MKRGGAGVPLTMADSMPFEGFFGDDVDSLSYFERFLAADGSGLDAPAAVIVETTQAEGGINVASHDWLRSSPTSAAEYGSCSSSTTSRSAAGARARSSPGRKPASSPTSCACRSRSVGLRAALGAGAHPTELDVWEPGEHNGTFRGNNAAFVTATAALEVFWSDDELEREVTRKGAVVRAGLEELASEHDGLFVEVKGTGLIQGLATSVPEVAAEVASAAFERGLIIETAGPADEVVKLLPPLIVEDAQVERALQILAESAQAAVDKLGDELVTSTEVEL
jgi:diaminobutyrate-2-oxoglutarate transaminase